VQPSVLVSIALTALCAAAAAQVQVSGVYPHLAMFNEHGECGIGAVVPFADRLWVVTYAPHQPRGSSDGLYEIRPDLRIVRRAESIGGTPADRLLHRETGQLLIGPYVIDEAGRVRAIPYDVMPGRLTAAARHLTDPARRIYVATMEEGLYEVDLDSLAVTELFADSQAEAGARDARQARRADLPGYHGKGLYSGQGVVVYANNGENSAAARARPDVASGCLAEWDGAEWTVVRRNQFTEVTGPGGVSGNADPARDPIWAVGWDHHSLLLMVREDGAWRTFRLPKGSHSYDGAHGWNTEWPRIREIGEDDLLMTMHGTFWRFPVGFSASSSAGIGPRSNYLKVVGDFCRWGERVVLGCDDTARSGFLNERSAKGAIAGPGQSHSNLWFVTPGTLDGLGPALGRGAVWLDEEVATGALSEPFLFAGYAQRGVHLMHGEERAVQFDFEVDRRGDGRWEELCSVEVGPGAAVWRGFTAAEQGAWVRVRAGRSATGVSVVFQYAERDARGVEPAGMFAGLATVDDGDVLGGLLRVRGERLGTLAVAALRADRAGVRGAGFHELDAQLGLLPVDDAAAWDWTADAVRIPDGVLQVDPASVLYVDDDGARWRLPKGDPAFDVAGPLGAGRVAREVVTERDLLHAHGTFYELPARNAGGFAKVRPISSHRFRVHDFCSYRGLLVLSGVRADAGASEHLRRAEGGSAAVWVGVIDDLWQLGKPRGTGGPWADSAVRAGVPSDPYLMTGYDEKSFELSHDAEATVAIEVQVDATGIGVWRTWRRFAVPEGETVAGSFPAGFHAYWLRTVADTSCGATVRLTYR
jgi:hypothetical protein